jgi:predicted dehydrogenase
MALEQNITRVCIVGAGSLSTKRIYPYIGAAGGRLVGVCDLDRDKASRNAARWGGEVYTDMATMLDAQTPDGVIICVGPEQHAQLARLSLDRRVPTYTEKPPALSAADAFETARLAADRGVLCTTAFKKRYCLAYSRAKQFIDTFASEDLYAISIDYCSGPYAATQSFLHDFCIHAIDLIGYLGGDVEQVFAFQKNAHAYAVSLKFRSGAVGTSTFSDGRSFGIPTEEVEITLRGGNFMSVHNSSTWHIAENGVCSEWREPPTFVSAGDSGYETGHLAEIEDFFVAIREDRSTRSCIYESYKTLVLYEAILASVREHKPVWLDYATL